VRSCPLAPPVVELDEIVDPVTIAPALVSMLINTSGSYNATAFTVRRMDWAINTGFDMM